MTTVKWHEQPLVAFDTETTGIDPHEARIVTAAAVHFTPGQRPRPIRWIIDPGVEIPAEAAAVHGWTNDRLARTIGRPDYALRVGNGQVTPIPRDAAIFEIAGQVASTIGRGSALVVHNAPYDLTLLEAECVRHDVPTLTSRPYGLKGVVDPMVIEKAYDAYRKTCYKAPGCDQAAKVHQCGGCRGGKTKCGGCGATDKTLSSLCAHYGVRHAGAHDCADDAVATVRLLFKLLAAWPQMASWRLGTLHEHQVTWRREQSDSLRDFWKRNGDERWAEVNSDWPMQRAAATAGVA